MTKRQIIEREWQPFADSFSATHRGWLLSLFVEDPFGGREYLARGIPFHAMTIDDDEESAILLLAGDKKNEHFGHVIHEVRRLLVDESADGHALAISVFGARGPVTVIEFKQVAGTEVPEVTDELVACND